MHSGTVCTQTACGFSIKNASARTGSSSRKRSRRENRAPLPVRRSARASPLDRPTTVATALLAHQVGSRVGDVMKRSNRRHRASSGSLRSGRAQASSLPESRRAITWGKGYSAIGKFVAASSRSLK